MAAYSPRRVPCRAAPPRQRLNPRGTLPQHVWAPNCTPPARSTSHDVASRSRPKLGLLWRVWSPALWEPPLEALHGLSWRRPLPRLLQAHICSVVLVQDWHGSLHSGSVLVSSSYAWQPLGDSSVIFLKYTESLQETVLNDSLKQVVNGWAAQLGARVDVPTQCQPGRCLPLPATALLPALSRFF